jgi:hypothetical protein
MVRVSRKINQNQWPEYVSREYDRGYKQKKPAPRTQSAQSPVAPREPEHVLKIGRKQIFDYCLPTSRDAAQDRFCTVFVLPPLSRTRVL